MVDNDAYRQRVKKLLAQDQEINDTQLKEFRMNLETTLTSWEERSKKIRRWLVKAIVILMITYLVGILFMPMYGLGQRAMGDSPMAIVYSVVIGIWFVAAWASMIAAIWLAILYFTKYAPALKRARFDVQTSMMLELQEQIVKLRHDLERRDK